MIRHARMTGRPTLWLPGLDHASIAAQYVLDKILAKEGEFVTAKGLYPPIKDAEKIKAVSMDELDRDEYKKWSAEMRKLFIPR